MGHCEPNQQRISQSCVLRGTESGTFSLFIPNNIVECPRNPGNIRNLDAAATVSGISSNNNLFIGPDLMSNIPSISLKFWEQRITVGEDIVEIFHQIAIEKINQRSEMFMANN